MPKELVRLGDGDVTATLIEATEKADGAEHVVIIIDKGDSFKLFCDGEQTVAELICNLEVARKWALDRIVPAGDNNA